MIFSDSARVASGVKVRTPSEILRVMMGAASQRVSFNLLSHRQRMAMRRRGLAAVNCYSIHLERSLNCNWMANPPSTSTIFAPARSVSVRKGFLSTLTIIGFWR